MSDLPRRAYNLRETAAVLGKDEDTIRRWIAADLLHAVKVGPNVMISEVAIDALLAGDPDAQGGPASVVALVTRLDAQEARLRRLESLLGTPEAS